MRASSTFPLKPSGRTAAGFAFIFTIFWTAIWILTNVRESTWFQAPNWDWANYHAHAIIMKRKIAEGAIVDAWVGVTGAHTPLLQFSSALLMLVFGENRIVAESVLVIYTFIFAYFGFRVIARLFDATTAALTLALSLTFPVFLLVSRVFLLEHALSAIFAAAMWSMLQSESFQKWKPTICFGILAGLASVTRLMAPVYFVGPGIIYLIYALFYSPGGRGNTGSKLLRFGAATATGIAVAASWYGPNWIHVRHYVESVTIGSLSTVYTDGVPPFSIENVVYYLQWILYEGPGVPLAVWSAFAAIIYIIRTRGKCLSSGPMLACILIFALDFCVLFPSGQKIGARYFLPIMPIFALAIVRSMIWIQSRIGRILCFVVTAGFSLHHVLALTVLNNIPIVDLQSGRGQEIVGAQLWNHRSLFLEMAYSVNMDPFVDLKIPQVVDRIEEAGASPNAAIYVMADHPFFQIHSVRLAALRARKQWTFGASELLRVSDNLDYCPKIRRQLENYQFIVARTGGVNYLTALDYDTILPQVIRSNFFEFRQFGEPVVSGDGAKICIFRRLAPTHIENSPAENVDPINIQFQGAADEFDMIGFRLSEAFDDPSGSAYIATMCLRTDRPVLTFPKSFFQFCREDISKRTKPDEVLTGRAWEPVSFGKDQYVGSGPWYIYHRVYFTLNDIQERVNGQSILLSLGFLETTPAGEARFKIQGNDLVDNGTRVNLAKIILKK